MKIITRSVSRDYLRNGKLNMQSGNGSYQSVVSSYGGVSGNYLPAIFNADGTYTVDLSKVLFTGNIVAEGEVTAYGAGESGGSSTGSVTIYDGLDSVAVDVALSANQGRILKDLIANVDLSDYYTKTQIEELLDSINSEDIDLSDYYKKPEVNNLLANYVKTTDFNTHTGDTTKHITSTERTNWNNTNTNFNDWFYKDSNGNIHSKYSFIGDAEISAYGAGSSSGSGGSITIVDGLTSIATDAALSANQGRILKDMIDNVDVDLSDYYQKNEVDSLVGSKASSNHTHNIADVSSLQNTLDDKADKYHSHSEYLTEHQANGGYIFAEAFSKTSFYTALSSALASVKDGESAIIDCTYFKGKHTITQGFNIDKPVTILFGDIDVTFNNSNGSNMFTFLCNNITIEGINRNTDKNSIEVGATIFRMTNADTTLNGYHIKSKGNKNLCLRNLTLEGVQTTLGRQYGNSSYPLNGVGGIYMEKADPSSTFGGNTCNNVRLENLLVTGTKAHGIYIDTPILSTIKNVRLSDIGGHGVFINAGTSLAFENVYMASANMAGFCIYGATYVSLNNCVAENCSIGFWLRSAFNVTMMSPGVEETFTAGTNPWRNSQPITKAYGFNLSTTDPSGNVVSISDVNSDASGYFIGYGILITGGRNINVFSPYIKDIAKSKVYEAYTGGTSISKNARYILVTGNCRQMYLANAGFKDSRNAASTITNEIQIDSDVDSMELIYNINNTTMASYTSSTPITNSTSVTAPIYCSSTSTVIRNGNTFYTDVNVEGNIIAGGDVTAYSDKRLKSDIKPLEVRGELNPVTYVKDGKESIGFIADEVKEVYPELVVTDESTEEKYLSLNYQQLTAVLYAEIKELKNQIKELNEKVRTMAN